MPGIPLEEWNGSKATRELHETIKQFNASSERQNQVMVRLTWATVILSFVMAIQVAAQIWMTAKQLHWL